MNHSFAVQTDSLTKAFHQREVVKNCNIHVEKGNIYGLLGANGAGKTTVFKLLSGLLLPTMGSVQIFNLDIALHLNTILSRIGTLIETPIFYEHLCAEDNLRIHLEYMGKGKEDTAFALSAVGLKNTADLPVSKFSLGMRQRLAVARAIVHKPELLILDEPINGLDPLGIREMRELFLKLKKECGMTILLSSHILNEIEHVADTIGVIVNGTIVEEVALDVINQKFPNGLEDYFFKIMSGGETRD